MPGFWFVKFDLERYQHDMGPSTGGAPGLGRPLKGVNTGGGPSRPIYGDVGRKRPQRNVWLREGLRCIIYLGNIHRSVFFRRAIMKIQ